MDYEIVYTYKDGYVIIVTRQIEKAPYEYSKSIAQKSIPEPIDSEIAKPLQRQRLSA